jgi:hypothetical protein
MVIDNNAPVTVENLASGRKNGQALNPVALRLFATSGASI